MGLLKAVIIFAISYILADNIAKLTDRYNNRTIVKILTPYMQNKCKVMLVFILIQLILF